MIASDSKASYNSEHGRELEATVRANEVAKRPSERRSRERGRLVSPEWIWITLKIHARKMIDICFIGSGVK